MGTFVAQSDQVKHLDDFGLTHIKLFIWRVARLDSLHFAGF